MTSWLSQCEYRGGACAEAPLSLFTAPLLLSAAWYSAGCCSSVSQKASAMRTYKWNPQLQATLRNPQIDGSYRDVVGINRKPSTSLFGRGSYFARTSPQDTIGNLPVFQLVTDYPSCSQVSTMGGSVLPGHPLYVPWKNGTPGASGIRSTRCQITSGRDRVDTLKLHERNPKMALFEECHLPDLVVFEVPGWFLRGLEIGPASCVFPGWCWPFRILSFNCVSSAGAP